MGTLYCPASCSWAAPTALDTEPKSAATWSWSMRLRVTVSPVAGSIWSSPVATLIGRPSRPPWESMFFTASLMPSSPATPYEPNAPLSVVATPMVTGALAEAPVAELEQATPSRVAQAAAAGRAHRLSRPRQARLGIVSMGGSSSSRSGRADKKLKNGGEFFAGRFPVISIDRNVGPQPVSMRETEDFPGEALHILQTRRRRSWLSW